MTDQGPPGHAYVAKMTDQVPHTEGLKTSGLSEAELKALSAGESKPIDEKRITIINVNINFETLVDSAKNRRWSYEEKMQKLDTIEKTLIRNIYKKPVDKTLRPLSPLLYTNLQVTLMLLK
jgi:hypothetical protein